ncbi:MAG TPA: DUF4783 domain-containing protein [Candidatus Krumholzibacteria bacterium]|nr:DUF4783 domain-containing protein [Candidatus Krumholzibacteria bacterium]
MTLRHCISALLIVILGASPVLAAPKSKAPQASEAPVGDSSPMSVLEDIEQGWTSSDADLILRHFGSNKVTIVIDGSGPGGSYSKDQGYYVFKELFKATTTKKFAFVQVRNSNESGASTFAIAERRYQRKDDGRQIKDKVYISLHADSGDSGRWVIDEIKSIR